MRKNLFPDDKILVTEHFDVHQDWEVPIVGFLIVAAQRKVVSVMEFNDAEIEDFMKVLIKVRKAMKEVLGIDQVYFFQNEKTSHNLFHMWILPHHTWMEQFGYKIEAARPIINHALENFTSDRDLQEVKEAAKKLNQYLNK